MPSDALSDTIARLHALRMAPPTASLLREQVNEIAQRAAKATGASVRVSDVNGMRVHFAGRNAVQASQLFAELAGSQAVAWGEQVAAAVVGRLL